MKDMLRLGTKDRKKYLIISVVSVLVIALITVSIIAVQLRHNKNEKKKKDMKRIVFWMVALLLMSGVAMAQGNRQGGRQQMDPKTRAQRMTERMVKEYSLNEDQKQQLLDVNLAWVEKMAANQGRHSKDDKAARMTKEEREKKAAEMKKSREDYDAQLKKILTKEQYDSYVKKQAEREKQMKEGRQNRQKRQG